MDENTIYVVVRNDEEQHSVWPVTRPVPAGWTTTGFRGSRDECLAHIAEVWPDIRPRSVREWLAAVNGRTT